MQRPEPTTGGKPCRALTDALQGLHHAYHSTTIYPPGHPSIPRALGEAAERFGASLADSSPIVIGVTRDDLLVDGDAIPGAADSLRPMARVLHDLDLAGVELESGVTADELGRLLSVLGRARLDGLRGGSVREALDAEKVEHIRVRPIDYDALTFVEGVHEGREHEDRRIAWDNLTHFLNDPSGHTPPEKLDGLARDIQLEVERHEGAGVGELRDRIHSFVRTMWAMPETDRERAREGLARFVETLSSELREDILRVDVRDPARPLALMIELSDLLPAGDLVQALLGVDHEGGRVPEGLVTLLNKLVRVSGERPELAQTIDGLLTEWGIPVDRAMTEKPDLREALEELFHSRSSFDTNPSSYQSLLDDLSISMLQGSPQPLEARYVDPRDGIGVRLQAAEIASKLLGRPDSCDERTALFARVVTAGDLLIEHARFGALRDAAIAARACSRLESESEEIRRAAAGYLDSLTERERISRIVEQACSGGQLPDGALQLIVLGGENGLDGALDALAGDPAPEVEQSLKSLVRKLDVGQISRLVERRAGRGWHGLKPVFPVIMDRNPAEAVPLLDVLLEHEDATVRIEALRAASRLDRSYGAAEGRAARALTDSDSQVVVFAIRILADLATEQALESMGAHVEGSPGSGGDAVTRRRCARALAGKSEAGRERLCRSLNRLRFRWKRADVLTGALIADVLNPWRDEPAVHGALWRWNCSVAGLLSRILGRPGHGGRAR